MSSSRNVILTHFFECVNCNDVLSLTKKRSESFQLSLEHPEAILCCDKSALNRRVSLSGLTNQAERTRPASKASGAKKLLKPIARRTRQMVAPERWYRTHASTRALTALARAEYVMRPSGLAGNLARTESITFSRSVSDSAAIILPEEV